MSWKFWKTNPTCSLRTAARSFWESWSSGFVRKEDARGAHESTGESDALLLATGELVWIMAQTAAEADFME